MWHAPRSPGRILFPPRDRGPTGSRHSSHRRRSAVFRLEHLEGRALLSTFTVENLADSGPGSLRQAVLDANANPNPIDAADVIQFQDGLHGTIRLTSGELKIELSNTDPIGGLTIQGRGADRLAVSGNNASRVFDISSGAAATIAGLTIADGLADGNAPIIHSVGGGILNQGNLTLTDVIVSHNQAVGATNDPITINGLRLIGVGTGGGVANLATLDVSGSTFTDNFVRGADNNNQSGAFPGFAGGGGLVNGGKKATATVTNCQFTRNLVQGGNGSVVTTGVPGSAGGGAIGNFGFGVPTSPGVASLTVNGSRFSNNQAIAGNDNHGRQFPGTGLGGAIGSHRMLNLNPGGTATLDISDSTFDHNRAIGGNHNVSTPGAPDPANAIPNHSAGGAVFVFGTGAIRDSTFRHNQAIGGQGIAGSGGLDITKNGGDARGGAINPGFGTTVCTLTNVTVEYNQAIGGQAGVGGTGGNAWGGGVVSTPSGVMLTITGSIIDHNLARGGPADTSGPASHGGEGAGGGVYNVSGSTTNVIASSINHNQAIGGAGSNGGNGGNGLGGGFYNEGIASLTNSIFEYNLALGGEAGSGGSDGHGIGGGVYTLVALIPDSNTIEKNHASTSNNDIGP